MRSLKIIILALVLVWLQAATLPAIRPLSVVPNLALVTIAVVSARVKASQALLLAVMVGWLLDSAAGSDYGLRTAFLIVLALAVATLKQIGSDLDNLSLLASVVVAATVVFNVLIIGNLALQHQSLPLGYLGVRVAIEAALNLALLVIVRWAINRLMGQSQELVPAIGGRRG